MNPVIYLNTIKTVAHSYVLTPNTPACQLPSGVFRNSRKDRKGRKILFCFLFKSWKAWFCDGTKVSRFWKAAHRAKNTRRGLFMDVPGWASQSNFFINDQTTHNKIIPWGHSGIFLSHSHILASVNFQQAAFTAFKFQSRETLPKEEGTT